MLVYQVVVTTPPASEPVSLAEAKLHLRVDDSAEDALITRLISAARIQCEQMAGRAFITRTLTAMLDEWPADGLIELPYPPVISVASIIYTDQAGAPTTWPASNYQVDATSTPGRIGLAYNKRWPTATLRPLAPIAVQYTAGYGVAAAVPEPYKQGMLLLIGHWYENREAVLERQTYPVGAMALFTLDKGMF
jgi:uncharacterized phiE125 gp8 family phage protein